MQPLEIVELQTNEIFYGRCRRCLLSVWLSQPLIVVFLIAVLNINVFQPFIWLESCTGLFTPKVFLVFFIVSIFQVVLSVSHICNITVRQEPSWTHWARYWKVLRPQNLIQILIYAVVCTLTVKFYLSLVAKFDNYLFTATEGSYCLNEQYLFCVINAFIVGFWQGVVYFDKNSFIISFPITQQTKFARVNEALLRTYRNSFVKTFNILKWFTVFYILLVGRPIKMFLFEFFEINTCCQNPEITTYSGIFNFRLLWVAWVTASIALFNLQYLIFLFEIFLTERYIFPLQRTPENPNSMLLQEALTVTHIPLIGYLAALDLRLLSNEKNSMRSRQLFAISVPGGHPYNWRSISTPCLYLLNDFYQRLTGSEEQQLQEPTVDPGSYIEMPPKTHIVEIKEWLDRKWDDMKEKSKFVSSLSFFIVDTPDKMTRNVFADSQPFIWLIEALSFSLIAGVKQNKYGVIQEEFVAIISIIMELEQTLQRYIRAAPAAKCYNPLTQRDFKLKKCLEHIANMSLNRLAWEFHNNIEYISLNPEQKRKLKSRAENI